MACDNNNEMRPGDAMDSTTFDYQQWQQCFDEFSQSYYWNTQTNECTWDPSQYLYQQLLSQANNIFTNNNGKKESVPTSSADVLSSSIKNSSYNNESPSKKRRQSIDNDVSNEKIKIKKPLSGIVSYDSENDESLDNDSKNDEQDDNDDDDDDDGDIDEFIEQVLHDTNIPESKENTIKSFKTTCRTIIDKLKALEKICDKESFVNIYATRIQIEVRLEDVIAGHLKTSYALEKLELAKERLHEYENKCEKLIRINDTQSVEPESTDAQNKHYFQNLLSLPIPPPPPSPTVIQTVDNDDALEMFYAQINDENPVNVKAETTTTTKFSEALLSSPAMLYIGKNTDDNSTATTEQASSSSAAAVTAAPKVTVKHHVQNNDNKEKKSKKREPSKNMSTSLIQKWQTARQELIETTRTN